MYGPLRYLSTDQHFRPPGVLEKSSGRRAGCFVARPHQTGFEDRDEQRIGVAIEIRQGIPSGPANVFELPRPMTAEGRLY